MIRRRIIAAFLVFGFAVGSAVFWNNGQLDWRLVVQNVCIGGAGLVLLHFRWRAQERRMLTPTKAKDIFS